MKGHPTTFVGLFDTPEDGRPAITAIEIPIIQRDFAQGRPDDEATAIRERFLDAMVQAATTDAEMALDFVYGDVKGGLLRPLDGQQRLTTLFLLHWYVASLAGELDPAAPWLHFTYATRPTARDFCETIAAQPFPGGPVPPSEWITDQPWYLYPWRRDPTISSMLVMLDEMHKRFDREWTDFGAVWARLVHREVRAIWFLFLPVADMDYGEDLYIKMNSRGKPLTPFEVFKADLEETLKPTLRGRPCLRDGHHHDQYEHLAMSIDGAWADLLWEYEKAGGDFVIDDEFMRYLTFIIDVCEWRDGQTNRRWRDKEASREWPLEERARLAFADPNNQHSARNRDFFVHAFDTWEGANPAAEFSRLFTAAGVGVGPLPLLVSSSPDLFGACIAKYGQEREFSLAETLMLFAVLLVRQEPRPTEAQLNRRLRTLRNLAESAFIDRKRMAEYIGTTERLIAHGTLDGAQGFNVEWTADEQINWDSIDEHPRIAESLNLLEDLTVIRGRLFAFELDADTIQARAEAFSHVSHLSLRDALGAALLTKDDYSRDVGWNGERRQLGSSAKEDSWRDLLTTGSRNLVARTRVPLMALLDDVHARMTNGDGQAAAALDAIRREWLLDREGRHYFDWRYYLVRYPGARSSMGEGYFNGKYDENRGGFSYGRIYMLYGANYSAYFSDALLRAAWIEGNLGAIAREPRWWHRDDPGMGMNRSAVEIRCVDDGLELVLPLDDEATTALAIGAIQQFSGVKDNRILVNQEGRAATKPIDREDRVQMCIRVVRALHESGL